MNTGKIFENNWKKSVPPDCYYLRLKDPAVGFTGGASSFAPHNPYDCLIYTGRALHCLELKSKDGAITYWRKDFEQDGKKHTFEIKKHQIIGLQDAAFFANVYAGLVINFRNVDRTYYIPIDKFVEYTGTLTRKSINYKDAEVIGVPVDAVRLKVNERYDIQKLLEVVELGS